MPFRFKEIAKVRSKDALARQMAKIWRERYRGDEVPQPRAISVRLGELEKDITRWWDSRPHAKRALSVAIDIPYEELPLARETLAFADFPELRSFNAAVDEPLALTKPDWFTLPRSGDRATWIMAPPGAGRSLAIHWHQARGTAKTGEFPTLAGARALLEQAGWVVLGVDAPDPEADESMLARIERRGSVVVIAPFALPEPPPTDPMRQLKQQVRWDVQHWRPVRGWRRMFARWVGARIEGADSLFDAEAFVSWLDDVDPREQLLSTPGDLLPLCALAHEEGEKALKRRPPGKLAEWLVGQRVRAAAVDGSNRSVWLRAWGPKVVRALAEIQLASSNAWRAGLSRDEWAKLVPEDMAARALQAADVDATLEDVAAARGKAKKKESQRRAREHLLRRTPQESLECLEPLRILRAQHGERLVLHPRWVADGYARSYIRQSFEGEPGLWGRWAVDGERRPLVDAELDELSDTELVALADKTVTAFDHRDLGTVGAAESLFAAVGRRIAPSWQHSESLRSLFSLQRRTLSVRYPGGLVGPTTRPGANDPRDESGQWVANCWAWSLYGPSPAEPIEDEWSWLFPGWGRPTLATFASLQQWSLGQPGHNIDEDGGPRDVVRVLPRQLWSKYMKEEVRTDIALPPSFERLLELATHVLEGCEARDAPARIPSVFVPAIALAPTTSDWVLGDDGVQTVVGTSWCGAYIAREAEGLPRDHQAAIAAGIWDALAAWQGGAVAALDQLARSPELYVFVCERLPTDRFARAVAPSDSDAVRRVGEVPSRFRSSFARGLADLNPPAVALLLWELPHAAIDEQDADWVEELGGNGGPNGLVQRTLWRIAPARALELATSTEPSSTTTSQWFFAAPSRVHPELLQVIEGMNPIPDWARMWLHQRVLDGGALADQYYQLLARKVATP